MATTQQHREEPPEAWPKNERNREANREKAAQEARAKRENSVAKRVIAVIGHQSDKRRVVCREVGSQRYRINLLEKAYTTSEFLEESRVLHSWMVWIEDSEIVKSNGDVPLGKC